MDTATAAPMKLTAARMANLRIASMQIEALAKMTTDAGQLATLRAAWAAAKTIESRPAVRLPPAPKRDPRCKDPMGDGYVNCLCRSCR